MSETVDKALQGVVSASENVQMCQGYGGDGDN